MIVGNGLIAKLFLDYDSDDVIFFASGVSNSAETDKNQFLREEMLVKSTALNHPEKIFIYFSTCSIYDSSKTNSPYVLHKLALETFIKKNCKHYLILRVSNAVGFGGNENLLMNYLISSINKNQIINVHTKATRNLIDGEDIKKITLKLLESKTYNRLVNIAFTQNYSIIEILEIIERQFDKKLEINLIKAGSGYEIVSPESENYFRKNNISSKEAYLTKIIDKYYTNK